MNFGQSIKIQSSEKIKELYDEFESLKQRITISENKRQGSGHKNLKIMNQALYLNKPMAILNEHNFEIEKKNYIKNSLVKFLIDQVPKVTNYINSKIYIIDKKLECISYILSEIPKMMIQYKKQKKKNHLNCHCKIKNLNIIDIQKRCNEEILRLKDNYDNKINVMINEIKNYKNSSSASKSSQKQLQSQIRNIQQKILLKNQEVNKLQTQNTQLKENFDSVKLLLNIKEDLISQLKTQLLNNQKKTEIYKIELEDKQKAYNSIISHQEKLYQNISILKRQIEEYKEKENVLKIKNNLHISDYEQKMKMIEKNSEDLLLEVSKLKKQNKDILNINNQFEINMERINNINEQLLIKLKNYEKYIQQLKNRQLVVKDEIEKYEIKQKNQRIGQMGNEQKSWSVSLIQIKKTQNSDDQQMFENLKVQNGDSLRHSHTVEGRQKKQVHLQFRCKKIEAELNLVMEQNKLLKQKKDKLEQQLKESQKDQQKFQIQGQIFRDEIKRLTIQINLIDECAVKILKNQQISLETLNSIQKCYSFPKKYQEVNKL